VGIERGLGPVRTALLRDLAVEGPQRRLDLGVQAGHDPLRPVLGGRVLVGFTSWDLLGLHHDGQVRAALVQASGEGLGAVSCARFAGGAQVPLGRCEARIAQFFGAAAGVLFPTKNQAVISVLTAVCEPGAVVLAAHSGSLPVADACVLAQVEFQEFDGLQGLRRQLERTAAGRRVCVVLESGSPLGLDSDEFPQLIQLVEAFSGWLVVDESVAFGVSGLRGAGSAELFPSPPTLLCRLASFLSIAGLELCAVVGSVELRELLYRRSRYLRVEPAPSGALAAAALAALERAEVALVGRRLLAARSTALRRALRAQGWRVLGDDQSPVVALGFDSVGAAAQVGDALLQRGVLLEALPARVVGRNGAALRALVSVRHSDDDLSSLLEGLAEVRRRLLSDEGGTGRE
jgi:7-keto-8-aminopelargonate synthetase-like enzyme